jgi:hypothetical protein
MYILNILFVFLIFYFSSNQVLAESFTVVGHTQYLLADSKKYNSFIKAFNANDSDYIFFLGDSGLGESSVFDGMDDQIVQKIYSVPGNGEYKKGIESYIDIVGYLNKDVETDNFVFLLLDSSQPLNIIQSHLKTWRLKYKKQDKTVVLLTHHRIWDDAIISAQPYKHDKSFYFRDVFPLLLGFVDYMIAGNSKRQHFQDLPKSLKNNRPPNLTTTYWEEDFQGIKAYNIGMGNGFPYSSYVSFKFVEDRLVPFSKIVKVSDDSLDKMGLVDMNLYSAVIRDADEDGPLIVKKLFIFFKIYQNLIYSFFAGVLFIYLISSIKKHLNIRKYGK